jgi:hypothetical protein
MEEVRRERGQGGDESDAAKTLGDDMSSRMLPRLLVMICLLVVSSLLFLPFYLTGVSALTTTILLFASLCELYEGQRFCVVSSKQDHEG